MVVSHPPDFKLCVDENKISTTKVKTMTEIDLSSIKGNDNKNPSDLILTSEQKQVPSFKAKEVSESLISSDKGKDDLKASDKTLPIRGKELPLGKEKRVHESPVSSALGMCVIKSSDLMSTNQQNVPPEKAKKVPEGPIKDKNISDSAPSIKEITVPTSATPSAKGKTSDSMSFTKGQEFLPSNAKAISEGSLYINKGKDIVKPSDSSSIKEKDAPLAKGKEVLEGPIIPSDLDTDVIKSSDSTSDNMKNVQSSESEDFSKFPLSCNQEKSTVKLADFIKEKDFPISKVKEIGSLPSFEGNSNVKSYSTLSTKEKNVVPSMGEEVNKSSSTSKEKEITKPVGISSYKGKDISANVLIIQKDEMIESITTSATTEKEILAHKEVSNLVGTSTASKETDILVPTVVSVLGKEDILTEKKMFDVLNSSSGEKDAMKSNTEKEGIKSSSIFMSSNKEGISPVSYDKDIMNKDVSSISTSSPSALKEIKELSATPIETQSSDTNTKESPDSNLISITLKGEKVSNILDKRTEISSLVTTVTSTAPKETLASELIPKEMSVCKQVLAKDKIISSTSISESIPKQVATKDKAIAVTTSAGIPLKPITALTTTDEKNIPESSIISVFSKKENIVISKSAHGTSTETKEISIATSPGTEVISENKFEEVPTSSSIKGSKEKEISNHKSSEENLEVKATIPSETIITKEESSPNVENLLEMQSDKTTPGINMSVFGVSSKIKVVSSATNKPLQHDKEKETSETLSVASLHTTAKELLHVPQLKTGQLDTIQTEPQNISEQSNSKAEIIPQSEPIIPSPTENIKSSDKNKNVSSSAVHMTEKQSGAKIASEDRTVGNRQEDIDIQGRVADKGVKETEITIQNKEILSPSTSSKDTICSETKNTSKTAKQIENVSLKHGDSNKGTKSQMPDEISQDMKLKHSKTEETPVQLSKIIENKPEVQSMFEEQMTDECSELVAEKFTSNKDKEFMKKRLAEVIAKQKPVDQCPVEIIVSSQKVEAENLTAAMKENIKKAISKIPDQADKDAIIPQQDKDTLPEVKSYTSSSAEDSKDKISTIVSSSESKVSPNLTKRQEAAREKYVQKSGDKGNTTEFSIKEIGKSPGKSLVATGEIEKSSTPSTKQRIKLVRPVLSKDITCENVASKERGTTKTEKTSLDFKTPGINVNKKVSVDSKGSMLVTKDKDEIVKVTNPIPKPKVSEPHMYVQIHDKSSKSSKVEKSKDSNIIVSDKGESVSEVIATVRDSGSSLYKPDQTKIADIMDKEIDHKIIKSEVLQRIESSTRDEKSQSISSSSCLMTSKQAETKKDKSSVLQGKVITLQSQGVSSVKDSEKVTDNYSEVDSKTRLDSVPSGDPSIKKDNIVDTKTELLLGNKTASLSDINSKAEIEDRILKKSDVGVKQDKIILKIVKDKTVNKDSENIAKEKDSSDRTVCPTSSKISLESSVTSKESVKIEKLTLKLTKDVDSDILIKEGTPMKTSWTSVTAETEQKPTSPSQKSEEGKVEKLTLKLKKDISKLEESQKDDLTVSSKGDVSKILKEQPKVEKITLKFKKDPAHPDIIVATSTTMPTSGDTVTTKSLSTSKVETVTSSTSQDETKPQKITLKLKKEITKPEFPSKEASSQEPTAVPIEMKSSVSKQEGSDKITLKVKKESSKPEQLSSNITRDISRETTITPIKLKDVKIHEGPILPIPKEKPTIEKLTLKLKKDGTSLITSSEEDIQPETTVTRVKATEMKSSEVTESKAEPLMEKITLKLKKDAAKSEAPIPEVMELAKQDTQGLQKDDAMVEKLTLKLKKEGTVPESVIAASKIVSSEEIEVIATKVVDNKQKKSDETTQSARESTSVEKITLKIKKEASKLESTGTTSSRQLQARSLKGNVEQEEHKLERLTLKLKKDPVKADKESELLKEPDVMSSILLSSPKDESKVEKLTLKLRKDSTSEKQSLAIDSLEQLGASAIKSESKQEKSTFKLKKSEPTQGDVSEIPQPQVENSEALSKEGKVEKLTLKLKKDSIKSDEQKVIALSEVAGSSAETSVCDEELKLAEEISPDGEQQTKITLTLKKDAAWSVKKKKKIDSEDSSKQFLTDECSKSNEDEPPEKRSKVEDIMIISEKSEIQKSQTPAKIENKPDDILNKSAEDQSFHKPQETCKRQDTTEKEETPSKRIKIDEKAMTSEVQKQESKQVPGPSQIQRKDEGPTPAKRPKIEDRKTETFGPTTVEGKLREILSKIGPKASTIVSGDLSISIAPVKGFNEQPHKLLKSEPELLDINTSSSTGSDDVRIIEDSEKKPEFIIDESSSQDVIILDEVQPKVFQQPCLDADLDIESLVPDYRIEKVIAKQIEIEPTPPPPPPKKGRGRPRKTPLVPSAVPVAVPSPPLEQALRPKRMCRGREERPPAAVKEKKPRGGKSK
ncbi:hypothetical protein C0J52_20288 [Blattella germanica]|nr:hypothetical protein C0J52_20288 [Blattella germanica]